MATHCSILAWRIPGTVEPGGLPSMGSHRVEHDWSDLVAAAAGYMTRSGITWSYVGLIPSSLRNLHTVFLSACITLHSHQQCKSIPFSPHLLQQLLFVEFFDVAIMTGVRCYLIRVLIWISLIMSNVEHLFMCSLAICMSSLEKCLLGIFSTFWSGCLSFWYWIVWAACIFWKLIFCHLFHLLLFSLILKAVFSPCL